MMEDKGIEAMVQTAIQSKVVEAFNSAPEVVEKMVAAALNKEVNEHGGKPSSYSDQKMPYLEWLVGEEIRMATRKVVHEHIENHTDQIKESVLTALQTADFARPIGDFIAGKMAESYGWQFHMTCEESS